ncbi:hypothetical protein ACLI08_08585 [Flavobacterium sp. RNTU_13]|uniref:hypothetical protein n=1 Tax=Flavobacterium sp. RNTU_13 TaxID=3375145 RepID=UPI00398583E8
MKKNTIKLGMLTLLLAGGFVIVSYASGNLFSVKQGTQSKEYKTQLMYLSVDNDDDLGIFDLEYNLIEKQDDANVSWKYFDQLYNNSLRASAKQQLAYIILVKKDLIGMVKDNPQDAEKVAALKKYVHILCKGEYTGFTTLYFALDALKAAGETDFVNQVAAKVYAYGKNEGWHKGVIEGGVETIGSQASYDKVVSDFTFVDKIKSL